MEQKTKGSEGENQKLLQSPNHGNLLFKFSYILIVFTRLNLPDSSYKSNLVVQKYPKSLL